MDVENCFRTLEMLKYVVFQLGSWSRSISLAPLLGSSACWILAVLDSLPKIGMQCFSLLYHRGKFLSEVSNQTRKRFYCWFPWFWVNLGSVRSDLFPGGGCYVPDIKTAGFPASQGTSQLHGGWVCPSLLVPRITLVTIAGISIKLVDWLGTQLKQSIWLVLLQTSNF